MQISQSSTMALTTIDIPQSLSFNLGGNQIGNKGCEF